MQTTRRDIAADNLFNGIFGTALDRTKIVTAVWLPKPQAACYMKFKNRASRYAIVGVFVARTPSGVRVAVTGAGSCVFRVLEMGAEHGRSFTPDAIKDIPIPQDGLNSDIHASAEYRDYLVGVMARCAVAGRGGVRSSFKRVLTSDSETVDIPEANRGRRPHDRAAASRLRFRYFRLCARPTRR